MFRKREVVGSTFAYGLESAHNCLRRSVSRVLPRVVNNLKRNHWHPGLRLFSTLELKGLECCRMAEKVIKVTQSKAIKRRTGVTLTIQRCISATSSTCDGTEAIFVCKTKIKEKTYSRKNPNFHKRIQGISPPSSRIPRLYRFSFLTTSACFATDSMSWLTST